MTRPRSLLPDGPFHVMCNAVHGSLLFEDDLDRRRFMGLLQQTAERYGWKVLTFALMGTHVHLLIWTKRASMSKGMWWLNWRYAMWRKSRLDEHKGRIFGSTYKSKAITTERYLYAVLRYIARNPVEAKLARTADAYRWSADRLLRTQQDLGFLALDDALGLFGGDPARYAAFVDGPEVSGTRLVATFAEGVPAERPSLDELLAVVSRDGMVDAHLRWGYTLSEIAEHVGIHRTTVGRRIGARGADGLPCDG